MEIIEKILYRFSNMKTIRQPYEAIWDECRYYTSPWDIPFNANWQPPNGSAGVYDDTAKNCIRDLVSTFGYALTNQASKWAQFESSNTPVNESPEVKAWFDNLEKTFASELNNSNFYKAVDEDYHSLIVYGNSCMLIEKGLSKKGEPLLNFQTVPLYQLYWDEDYKGSIDTVYRLYEMNAKNVVDVFGVENVSDTVLDFLGAGNYDEKIQLLHAVEPRIVRTMDKDGEYQQRSTNMKFGSYFIEYDTGHLLLESGYNEMPYAIARYAKTPGQVYGHGIIMDNIDDIRTINVMRREFLIAGNLATDPALLLTGTSSSNIKNYPGAVNSTTADVKLTRIQDMANFVVTDAVMEGAVRRLEDSLLRTAINIVSSKTKEMTATEVTSLNIEARRILSPVMARYQNEKLVPLSSRVIDIIGRNTELLGVTPEALLKSNFVNVFVNQLAIVQKRDEINNMMSAYNTIRPIIEANPTTFDIIDSDEFAKEILRAFDVPTKIIKSDKAIRDIRKQRAEAQQMEAEDKKRLFEAQLAEIQAKSQDRSASANKKNRG